MSTTESGRTVHWATGLQHQKQKNHGLRASLRFALRPWFQDSHRKWYNYWGQVMTTCECRRGLVGYLAV